MIFVSAFYYLEERNIIKRLFYLGIFMSKYNYEWTLKDANFTKDKGKVFSCFACGGGSTMGYKLAGFDVIGCNEIDPKMNECYVKNHNPKYNYLMDIREFKNLENLPEDLYNLDILDGSPPCSSFSMAGNRGKDWGKEKKFREGQASQVLDTLFFDFIDVAKRLKPKIVIAENVKGLIQGEAKEYVDKIFKAFDNAGYKVGLKLLDASKMGVPQKRQRVFFYGIREDLLKHIGTCDLFGEEPELDLNFEHEVIHYKEIREEQGNESAIGLSSQISKYWKLTKPGNPFSSVHEKGSYFNEIKAGPDKVLPTIRANGVPYDYKTERILFDNEIKKAGSFPMDYNFMNNKSYYIIGMSVPPLMTANIADRIYTQWLSKLK